MDIDDRVLLTIDRKLQQKRAAVKSDFMTPSQIDAHKQRVVALNNTGRADGIIREAIDKIKQDPKLMESGKLGLAEKALKENTAARKLMQRRANIARMKRAFRFRTLPMLLGAGGMAAGTGGLLYLANRLNRVGQQVPELPPVPLPESDENREGIMGPLYRIFNVEPNLPPKYASAEDWADGFVRGCTELDIDPEQLVGMLTGAGNDTGP